MEPAAHSGNSAPPQIPPAGAPEPSRNPLRRLYRWTLHWSSTRPALAALIGISFFESSFFPIPPDLLLMPMCFADRAKAWTYAFWCSVASVAGGVFGWVIGWGFYEAVGAKIIHALHGEAQFDHVRILYADNAFLAVLAAAFTPIPYKVFTIAAGVFGVPLYVLLLGSAIGRSGRFFLVAGSIRFFGPLVKPWLDRYFEVFTIALFVLAVLGYLAIRGMP
jgi:membrane protein YqaA with SNARE-associated domain